MRPTETLHHPDPNEPRDDTTPVVENGGHIHLAPAAEEDAELFFERREDSDGDPNHPANPNSRAYNSDLEDRDEPLVDPNGDLKRTDIDQFPDIPSSDEIPESTKD